MQIQHAVRTFTAVTAFAALTMGVAAAGDVPSYASSGETVRGTVMSVSGSDLTLRDERGFVDHVRLRERLVLNPADLQLSPGQPVTISGRNGGSVFIADEIDAVSSSDAAAYPDTSDAYAYAPDPGYYPYPYYGPYYYPGYFGPYYGASIGFFFGGRGFGGHGFGDRGFGGRGFGGRGFGSGGFGGHGIVGHSVGGAGAAHVSSGGRR